MPASERLTAAGASLLVVDVQDKLLAAIPRSSHVVAHCSRLIQAAALLHIPVLATEQYPKGLGPTAAALRARLPVIDAKTQFHAADAVGLTSPEANAPIRHVTVVGIETHVCILQTALELLRRGFAVQVPADAVGARGELDHTIALRRIEMAGGVVTTTETVMFEWTERSDHPAFKSISALVKEFDPEKGISP
jgi:nicotinamidase-related amidase